MRLSYHKCPTIERLNCMQFDGQIAQKESAGFGGVSEFR
jgi:hypothetical protein